VIRFAMGGSCRQREILRYFGEENAERCGHCDNCRLHDVKTSRLTAASTDVVIDDNILRTVRIVLSGVARAKTVCSCGRNLIAQMLCGSGIAKLKKLGFDNLSTFGLLENLTQNEVLLIIDSLMAMRCLQQIDVDRFRPVVELTEFGGEVMRGTASLPGELPLPAYLQRKLRFPPAENAARGVGNSLPTGPSRAVAASPSTGEISELPEPDAEILESLKQWRGEIADEAGVPLHYILSNATLTELARLRPATREDLLAVKGIGPVKAERYGHTLLEIVSEGRAEGETRRQGDEEIGRQRDIGLSGVSQSPPLPLSPSLPSSHWTHRLLAAGFTVDECMAIRGLPREVVLEHARQAEQNSADQEL